MKSPLSDQNVSITLKSHINVTKSVNSNFGEVLLTFDYENVSNLMTFGTGWQSGKFGYSFFVRQIGSRAFVTLIFLKREKSNLSNIATLYIIQMQILHRFEKTKEPMSENQYLSQYAVGLPYEIS